MGVNDGLIKNTRREQPIVRTTAPGLADETFSYSCGFDDAPSGLLITNGSDNGDSGMEKAESGALDMIFSISLCTVDRAEGDRRGDIFEIAFR